MDGCFADSSQSNGHGWNINATVQKAFAEGLVLSMNVCGSCVLCMFFMAWMYWGTNDFGESTGVLNQCEWELCFCVAIQAIQLVRLNGLAESLARALFEC